MLKPRKFTIQNHPFWMLPVDGATYTMGSDPTADKDAYEDESPLHTVQISSFYLAQYPATQALWTAITSDNPSFFTGAGRPVEDVSWDQIVQSEAGLPGFLEVLNGHPDIRKDLKTGERFRLPTEAEWEYAARGGVYNTGLKYAGSNHIKEVAWFDKNSHSETKPAGLKFRNELGLYDISGNVWEWCEDWYGGSEYYEACKKGLAVNPTGPEKGALRVLRGGSWSGTPQYCRTAYRSYWQPGLRYRNFGFRLALSLQAEE
jgi:formylglycine-generating enzyme required for sulfatase activity